MRLLILIFGSILLFSCENELDLSAEYDETIVVYGLLDQSQDTQYVKINKTFLGDESALDYAQRPDSFIYRDITATLTDLSTSTVITLNPFDAPKEPGLFSHEENLVYITDDELIGGNKYRLDVRNHKTDVSAHATTEVIKDFNIAFPLFPTYLIGFREPARYSPQIVRYKVQPNVFRYELTMFFTYYEYPKTDTNDVTVKTIEFPLGVKFATEAVNNELVYTVDGEIFYTKVAEKVPFNNSVDREIGRISFLMRGASEELQLYINANGPLDGIAQVRPEYSNIENGIGLFASKYESRSISWKLSNETVSYLITHHPQTKFLNFKIGD